MPQVNHVMHRSAHAIRLACILLTLMLASCQREVPSPADVTIKSEFRPTESSPAKPTFAQQAEAVRTGASDTIRLDDALVTDRDLAQLEGLDDKLRRINLSHTKLSDAALARLARCTELEQLRIASPYFTDRGLAALAEMPKLKYLHLIGAPLTGESVPHLSKLTALSSLYLDGTQLSLDDMRALVAALPTTHIHFDGGHHRDDTRADVHAK